MDIWLPQSLRPRWQCNIPDCGQTFAADQKEEYIRHVTLCANAHRSSIEEMSGRHHEQRPFKDTVFDGPIDPEAASWLKRRFPRRR